MTQTRAKTRAERQAELMAQQAPPDIPVGVPEPNGPTATEQLQALRELRHSAAGPIVPRPAALTLASVRAWLKQVADLGSPGDVEVAWHSFHDGELKKQLVNEYKKIQAAAGPRYYALVESAMREEQERRLQQQRRAAADTLAKEIVRDQAVLAEKRRRLTETQPA